MSTAERIRSFVLGFGAGRIFTTRQVLKFGTRNAVDLTLSRLVRSGFLRRLSYGVFIFESANEPRSPDSSAIAAAKAEAFGKRIYGVQSIGRGNTFLTNGPSSSFASVCGRIFFKASAPGKFKPCLFWQADELIRHLVNVSCLCKSESVSISYSLS